MSDQRNEFDHDKEPLGFRTLAVSFPVFFFVVLVALILVIDRSAFSSLNAAIPSFDSESHQKHTNELKQLEERASWWHIPDLESLPEGKEKEYILYGQQLIMHTSRFLGPNGSVRKLSNGMNCQNCHLDAGTKIWGNNYGGVRATYPKLRARSGKIEDIPKRINDCIQRSLNGKALERNSREMRAIVAYIDFLGSKVPKDTIPRGTGIHKLSYLQRPADPMRGKLVYETHCASCHGTNGEGMPAANGFEYVNPPLWGDHSYNTGAGMYRLSRLAGYVKYNMPYGVRYPDFRLSDAECWDVAAFINSQPRPVMDISGDWPDISKKPVDHPFGPFIDGFSEQQHKYGPFGPIEQAARSAQKK
jgi:thiosulfate dehydrogenase